MSMHIGRQASGHEIEDECPCPQEACGLVSTSMIHPDCDQHPFDRARTLRQAHPAETCGVIWHG